MKKSLARFHFILCNLLHFWFLSDSLVSLYFEIINLKFTLSFYLSFVKMFQISLRKIAVSLSKFSVILTAISFAEIF